MNTSRLSNKNISELQLVTAIENKGTVNRVASTKKQGIVIERTYSNPAQQISSMLLTMPFQPSIWDEKILQKYLQQALQFVNVQMKDKFSTDCIAKIIARLELIFKKLNQNTHRKGVAILLNQAEEKILYLNFPIKNVLILKEKISILDFANTVLDTPGFFYLMLNEDATKIYEYHSQQLWKIYEQHHEPCSNLLLKNLSVVFDQLNFEIDKPVFTTGTAKLLEQFCGSDYFRDNYFTLCYDNAVDQPTMLQTHLDEITGRWEYWKSKFILQELQMAQKAGTLVKGLEPVMSALRKGVGGSLLIDSNIEQQLKTGLEGMENEKSGQLLKLVEDFLVDGHLIKMTTSGLLNIADGIALISNTPNNTNIHFNNKETGSCSGGELF